MLHLTADNYRKLPTRMEIQTRVDRRGFRICQFASPIQTAYTERNPRTSPDQHVNENMNTAPSASHSRQRLGAVAFLSSLLIGSSASDAASPGHPGLPDVFSADRLLWKLELGSHQYTVPIVDNGQIFLGVNDMELDHPAVQPTGGGTLMCRNAKTGEIVWQHDMVGGVWCASATVVNGRVYVGTERMVLWVLKAGRAKEVLARSRTKSMAITAVAAEDIFYLPTQRRIFAVRLSE